MPKTQTREIPTVAVIIVSFNTATLTVKALQTLFDSQDVHLSVVVVDNNSSDRTISALRRRFKVAPNRATLADLRAAALKPGKEELFPGVVADTQKVSSVETATVGSHELFVLLSTENLGFGRANNLGAVISDTDYILFLNSDTEVKPDTVKKLLKYFTPDKSRKIENPGIIAAQLLNPDGSVQLQGGMLPTLGNIFRWIMFLDDIPGMTSLFSSYQHHESEMRSIARRQVAKVGWVGGTAMMVSRACLEEIGGFDPAIFMYAEDIDLCWRATQKHWDIAITSEAEVIHHGSASSSKKNAVLGEISGLVYMWRKYHSLPESRLLFFILRVGLSLRVILFGILRQYGRQRIYREALALVR